MAPEMSDAIIRVRDISVQFGATKVLDGLNLDVKRGEILGFVGPSGAGKSVLTRTIIGLVPKVAGRIEVFGIDLDAASATARRGVERRWGILFQQGALFSSSRCANISRSRSGCLTRSRWPSSAWSDYAPRLPTGFRRNCPAA
jgi:phospholipid/cholesterol/gamma-HCH transport system ATP-binding protein